MGKNLSLVLLYVSMLSGFCFGYSNTLQLDSTVSLMHSRSIYTNEISGLSPKLTQQILRQSNVDDSAIQVQKIPQERTTPSWKPIAIYGTEFLASGIAIWPISYKIVTELAQENSWGKEGLFAVTYIGGSTLIGGTITWTIGKFCRTKSTLWKSFVGAGSGSVLTLVMLLGLQVDCADSNVFNAVLASMSIGPSLGAVIGCNF